jgi:hypothetical protein
LRRDLVGSGFSVFREALLGAMAAAGFGAGGPLGAGHGLSWGDGEIER